MNGRFATTQWSLVVAAGDSGHAAGREALERLCGAYWPPVYGYVRRRGHDPETARDLTQEFFTRLLDKRYLKTASRERGRFRTFLLTAVKHFLANEHDRATARKRGGEHPPLSLDVADAEKRHAVDRADDVTPEILYERRWALTLLDRVLERLEREMAEAGHADRFAACRSYLVADAGPSYREVAERFGIAEGAVKVTVHRMRKRFGALLRDEVRQTLADGGDTGRDDRVDDEVRHLLTIVAS